MERRALLFLLLVVAAPVAFAQTAAGSFWDSPGTTLRDSKGNITYTEIKDPKTFTMRVFDRDRWVTYYYEPNSSKLTKVEASDTTDEYLYDGGQWNGRTVHARGRAHTIHVTDGLVAANDMPPITIERDQQGRDRVVKRGTEVVAAIQYDTSGQVRGLTMGAVTLTFEKIADGVRETLTANGALLITTVARAEGKHQFPTSLDSVAGRLGLPSDWRNSVHFTRSTTGSLTSVYDALNHPVVEIIQMGGMGAAFDASNAPLFYDLRLNYTSTAAYKPNGGDAFADVTTLLNGVLPDSLIVPVTGNASAYVSRPRDGAISSVWTVNGGSQPTQHFTVYHEGVATAALASASVRVTADSRP